ncbi:MAG: shikimate kinase [bacterium]
MNIILMGMKHCGKSTLGRRLAEHWNCPFYDIDAIIEENYACETGLPLNVREIFLKGGDEDFKRVESHVVCELYMKLEKQEGKNVIAVGGRTTLNEANCRLLREMGLMVFLQVSPHDLFDRVKRSGIPGFLDGADPETDFLSLCQQREPQYLKQAQLTVNLEGLDVDRAFEGLVRQIESV